MHSFQEEISNLLDTFATWNRCFTIQEVADWSGEVSDSGQLHQCFQADSRFVLVSQQDWGPEFFVPEKTLFQWWTNFNLRLAQIKHSRLSERHLTYALNSLRPDGIWDSLPVDLIRYGEMFGFVAPAWAPGFYVFPMAHLLSQVNSMGLSNARVTLTDFASPEIRSDALQRPTMGVIESWLSSFNDRASHIVKCREGIPPYKRMTLEELGSVHGCTRERIRQIERNFWKKALGPRAIRQSPLFSTFLAELLRRQGSLILRSSQEATASICFLCKCIEIPYCRLGIGDFVLLGLSNGDPIELQAIDSISRMSEPSQIASQLDSGILSFIGKNDIYHVAEAIVNGRINKATKAEKIYLALRSIGKPAHFSKVAEVYNTLFPDDPMSDHNVHAILSRCAAPDVEQHGIVWVRVKGTYALKEHGYKRPELGIFEAVAKIVKDKYEETGKPIHVGVIATELGKHRQLVDPASFAFATGANEHLEQVSKDYFVPRDAEHDSKPELAASDLDSILREFRATRQNKAF